MQNKHNNSALAMELCLFLHQAIDFLWHTGENHKIMKAKTEVILWEYIRKSL